MANRGRATPAQRLRQSAEPLVAGERLIGAFLAFTGPQAGMELYGAMFLGLLGALGVASRRRIFTVIVTDKAVLVYRNGRRADSPTELPERHVGHASLGALNGTMEYSIDVAGTIYNVQALWSDEVRKINRALGRSITGS
jgi:hypothetical protein